MKMLKWLDNKLTNLKHILAYKRTVKYLLKKRGLRAAYNFLFIKSFIAAGGEGTSNWIGKFFDPIFKTFPKINPMLVPFPNVTEIEITNVCNKKCIICEHTYWNEPNLELNFNDFKKIVDQFPKLKWVNLTGEGDAFLNKDYIKMIEYLKSKDIPVFLVDSFDLINEEISKKLIELRVDGIWISFDAATKETYEKIKIGCKFEKSLNNIKKLIELKSKIGSPIPEVCFRYIINTLNVCEMPKFIELVHSLGDRSALGDGTIVEFAGLLVFNEVKNLYVPEVPKDILEETLRKAKQLDVILSFSHANKYKLPPLHHCRAWMEPYIMMGGYVMPCCAVLQNKDRILLRQHSFGNILELDMKRIWNSNKYKKFRNLIPDKKAKVPILCRGCRAYNTNEREKKYGIWSG